MLFFKLPPQIAAIFALMIVAVVDAFAGDWGNFAVALFAIFALAL
jgi:hypothetical protein